MNQVNKLNIVLARKPLSEKSVAENVLKHGTGGLNIDGSRIGINGLDLIERQKQEKSRRLDNNSHNKGFLGSSKIFPNENVEQGRFPANIIFDEEAGKILDEQSGISKARTKYPELSKQNMPMNYWDGVKEKHIAGKDQTKSGFDDKGGASRYFKNIKNDE